MTRQPSPTPNTPTSWQGFKDLARQQYERGDYEAALVSYTQAIQPDFYCPASEQQILLSNLVACRLKIGGPAQARAAIDNAKQCIALNPNWAKGHVRLASAYIALGGHSNDACNELQRALSLDPGNSTAREMLIRELRRDHAAASASAASSNNTTNTAARNDAGDTNNGSSTTATDENRNSNNNTATNSNSSEFSNTASQRGQQDHQQHYNNDDNAMDDSLTFWERLEFHWGRATAWYQSQSEDLKTILKIGLLLLVLYVAFGGRFGLANKNKTLGNYGSNSVYDQYRKYGTTESARQHQHQRQSSRSSYPYDHPHGRRTTTQRQSSYRRHSNDNDDDYYYDDDASSSSNYYNSRRSSSSYWGGGGSGYGGFNPFDGSIQSMLLLSGIAFAGHRMGINPFHTMMVMNVLGGGRRRFRPRGGFGMGYGGGMGGFGFGARRGFGRRRY